MIEQTKILLWRALALLGLLLGVIGALLPVVPTVPFLLMAAWAAGKGWPALEARLLNHPVYGPPIQQWRANRAVSRKVKVLACTMMSCSAVMLWFMPVPDALRWGIYTAFVLIGTWLCLRPEPEAERRLPLPVQAD
jgi:uncharacterized protein